LGRRYIDIGDDAKWCGAQRKDLKTVSLTPASMANQGPAKIQNKPNEPRGMFNVLGLWPRSPAKSRYGPWELTPFPDSVSPLPTRAAPDWTLVSDEALRTEALSRLRWIDMAPRLFQAPSNALPKVDRAPWRAIVSPHSGEGEPATQAARAVQSSEGARPGPGCVLDHNYSPLDCLDEATRGAVLHRWGPLKPAELARFFDGGHGSAHRVACDAACGALVGLAVADALGAHLEFLPVVDTEERAKKTGAYFDRSTSQMVGAENCFLLKPGQWTDDTAMALCLADSLLWSATRRAAASASGAKASSERGERSDEGAFDGSDLRSRFYNWWERGMNNA